MKTTPISGGHRTPKTLTNYLGIKIVLSSVCLPPSAKTNFHDMEKEAVAESNC